MIEVDLSTCDCKWRVPVRKEGENATNKPDELHVVPEEKGVRDKLRRALDEGVSVIRVGSHQNTCYAVIREKKGTFVLTTAVYGIRRQRNGRKRDAD